MIPILKGISSFITLLLSVTKGILNIQEAKNAPDVKAAAKAKQELEQQEREEKAIEDKNIEEIRKNLAD